MRTATTLLFTALVALLAAAAPARAEEEPALYQGRDAASWAGDLVADGLEARRQATYALWQLDQATRPHVGALARALRDDDEYVRTTAERVLTRFGWQQSINTLSSILSELVAALADERAAVRFAAVKLIWAAGPQPNVVGGDPPPDTLVPALVKVLGDEDARVRANAAAALANLQGSALAAVPALTARLSDKDVDVRMWAVRALSWIDPQHALSSVLALVTDGAAGVRAAVLEAAAGAPPEQATQAVEVLTRGAADVAVEVRRTAVNGLWMLGRVETLPTLVRVLKADEDATIRAAAGNALGGLGDPAAVPPLMAALLGADETTRLGAARGLCQLGPEGAAALPRLVELLQVGTVAERTSVALSLGQLAPWSAPALPALRAALRDEDPGLRSMAASTLSALAIHGVLDEATLKDVITTLADTEPQVLQYALGVVWHLGPAAAGAVPALLSLHERDVPLVGRALIYNALQRIGPAASAALPTLRAAVAVQDEDRLAAAAALACVAEDEQEIDGAVQILIDALRDESRRSLVLHRLKSVGPRARRAGLLMRVWMLGKEDWRYAAAGALLHMEGASASDAVELIDAGLRSDTPARALGQLDEVREEGRALIPALLELAGDPAQAQRGGALVALRRVGARGEAARAVYTKARTDPSAWIRTLGAQGLDSLAADTAPDPAK